MEIPCWASLCFNDECKWWIHSGNRESLAVGPSRLFCVFRNLLNLYFLLLKLGKQLIKIAPQPAQTAAAAYADVEMTSAADVALCDAVFVTAGTTGNRVDPLPRCCQVTMTCVAFEVLIFKRPSVQDLVLW